MSTATTAPLALSHHNGQFNPWLTTSTVIALLAAVPVAAVLLLALQPAENIWPHLVSTVLPSYLFNTAILLLGVGVAVFITGVSTAWIVTACDIPGRRWLEWILLLPMAMPAYVIAYVYTDLLEYAGPVQQGLRALFGWQQASDYWFPQVRSLGGAITLMGLVLYPYVYLLSRAAFLEQSTVLLEASRVLGNGPWRTFFTVALPIARPAVAVGTALAMMEALNDFGTVDYFAVKSLTAGIYDVWLGMGNLGGAAQIASIMLIFVMTLITLERIGRRRHRFHQGQNRFKTATRVNLSGWRKAIALAICIVPVVGGFLIPVFVLGIYALNNFLESWTSEFRSYIFNSLFLSIIASLSAVTLALLLAYSKRLCGGWLQEFTTRIAAMGYAVPGAVLAIGVIIPFAGLDKAIHRFMGDVFGVSTGLIFSGTVFAILFAYTVRFLAVSLGSVESSLAKITPSMDMAARSLGYTPLQTLGRFHLPLLRGGLLTAGLMVFVDCMKELPATLILRPFNFDTLATHVYQFASDEMIERSALAALLIVLSGLLPVILLSRTITKSREYGKVTESTVSSK